MCVTANVDGTLARLILTADYAVTEDELVHGAINGVDWGKRDEAPRSLPFDLNDAEVINGLHALVDCPFSFRTHSTSVGLMVSDIKIAADETILKKAKLFGGMYTFSKDGTVPTPKPGVPTKIYYGGMSLPSGRYLDHYPQYFAPDPVHPLPRKLADMEDPEGAARRAGQSPPSSSPMMLTPSPPNLPPSMPEPTPPGIETTHPNQKKP